MFKVIDVKNKKSGIKASASKFKVEFLLPNDRRIRFKVVSLRFKSFIKAELSSLNIVNLNKNIIRSDHEESVQALQVETRDTALSLQKEALAYFEILVQSEENSFFFRYPSFKALFLIIASQE